MVGKAKLTNVLKPHGVIYVGDITNALPLVYQIVRTLLLYYIFLLSSKKHKFLII